MKKIIIGVHGLGNKPPKYLLQKWWKDAINEGIKKSELSINVPNLDLVYWADILYDKPLNYFEKNKHNPYYLDEPYLKAINGFVVESHSVRKKITDFITGQLNKIFLNEDKSLNYRFITDIIIKKYFKDLDIYYNEENSVESKTNLKIREHIRQRLADTIKKYEKYDILIVAHSMGSIIAFDVLNYLVPEIKIHTLVTIGSPLGLPVVVSKIAAEQKHNGANIMSTPPGIVNNWFNMADIRDHVALNYILADDFIANENGVLPKDFQIINDYEVNGVKNPHKSFGYLRSAEFIAVLSDFMADQSYGFGQKVMDKVQSFVDKVKAKHEMLKDKLNIN